MKKLFIIIFIAALGCKKSSDPLDKFANNRIDIEVFYPSGTSFKYSFHGSLAPMYLTSGIYGNDKLVADGKLNPSESKIRFGAASADPTNTKVSCAFYPGGSNPNSYSTGSVSDPGTIHFTTFTDNFAEGFFSAKCATSFDSILIKGTFKGNYNK